MQYSTEIKKILNLAIRQLKEDLQNHPYFLINEHDLQAYLYSKFVNEDLFNKYVTDQDGDENYLVHCEYPRGYYKNEKFKRIGRWDIAILKEQQNNDSWWTKKPVSIGIELKLKINRPADEVKLGIYSERKAVRSTKEKNKYADWAILFHMNIGKKKHDNTFDIVSKYITTLQKKNPKTFYVYIESYRDKSEPQVILSSPIV